AERAASAQLTRLAALAEAHERLTGDMKEATRAQEEAEVALSELPSDENLRLRANELREHVSSLRLELAEARAQHESIRREAEARTRRLAAIAQESEAWVLRA